MQHRYAPLAAHDAANQFCLRDVPTRHFEFSIVAVHRARQRAYVNAAVAVCGGQERGESIDVAAVPARSPSVQGAGGVFCNPFVNIGLSLNKHRPRRTSVNCSECTDATVKATRVCRVIH